MSADSQTFANLPVGSSARTRSGSTPDDTTDPALVAARAVLIGPALLSGTAAAALGAGGGVGTPVGGSVPGTLPGAAATSSTSRYATTGTAQSTDAEGRVIVYRLRRALPQPDDLATVGFERVADGDRADLLAARLLGDPDQWWRLADANVAARAEDLEAPGLLIRVTLPEGFPGAPE